MEPYRTIGTQEIRGQQWIAIKWNYHIDSEVYTAMIRELQRELPDELAYSSATKTNYVKIAAFPTFENIVGRHIDIPPSLDELDEAFASHRKPRPGFEDDGYDSRGMTQQKPVPVYEPRETHYLDPLPYPGSAKPVEELKPSPTYCEDCGTHFKSARGLAIHRGHQHK